MSLELEAALAELPVFPLPGAVLFPQAHLELHIFEPRYRALLAACLMGHRCMAIAQIVVGEVAGMPRIATIAGVGRIEHHVQLPDGRSHIALVGQARVRLDELPFIEPFRRARAKIVADIDDTEDGSDELTLLTAIQSFVEALRKDGSMVTFERGSEVKASELAHHAAQHLLVDSKVKQEILEMRSPRERIARVAAELFAQRAMVAGPGAGKAN